MFIVSFIKTLSMFLLKGFVKHMNGKKHKSRMEELLSIQQSKLKQMESRVAAESHLRQIEGKPRLELI